MLDKLRDLLTGPRNGTEAAVTEIATALVSLTMNGGSDDLAATLRRGTWIDDVLGVTHRHPPSEQDRQVLTETLRDRDREDLRAGALWLFVTLDGRGQRHAGKVFLWNTAANDALVALARRKLGWEPAEVQVLWAHLSRLVDDRRWELAFPQLLRIPLAAAEELADGDLPPLIPTVHALLSRLTTDGPVLFYDPTERSRFTRRLRALVDRCPVDGAPQADWTLSPAVLGPGDEFGPRVRAELLETYPAEVAVPLLWHLADYSGSVAAGKKWRARLNTLLAEAPARGEVARVLLERACEHVDSPQPHHNGHVEWVDDLFVLGETAQLLRAAVWAVRDSSAPWVPSLLGQVAVHCGGGLGGAAGTPRCSQVTSSAIAALGELDDDVAVAQLSRIQTRVKNKTLRKSADTAVAAVAARAGLTPGQLLERSVPTFGLTAEASTERHVGEHAAVLDVQVSGVRLTWRTGTGRTVRSVPKVVKEKHADAVAELRATVKEAGKVLSTERARLEGLLSADREWLGSDWVGYYLEHPLTGVFARGLLWQTAPPAAGQPGDAGDVASWVAGLPERDSGRWGLRSVDGRWVPVPADARVRLWHPIGADAAEVAAWRAHLTDQQLRQPFKQAFREVYLLTPAEEATDTYSNRFAGHILRYRQAGALMRTRGWVGNHLGYWDGGYDGQTVREVGEGGWRATFFFDLVDNEADGYETPSLCASDQVHFERRTAAGWERAPLAEVPALVFTEAMRDVDLFVGVTSIAADPAWEDRGEGRYRDYWYGTGFGDLTESAQIRRDALTRLMPRTKIADKVRVTDRFLEVDGTFHTYKIHLGSGNILMSPNDAYLCIVAGRGTGGDRVFLPFEEGGGVLSLIVSKAFLLADDDAITDPTITRQIRG